MTLVSSSSKVFSKFCGPLRGLMTFLISDSQQKKYLPEIPNNYDSQKT